MADTGRFDFQNLFAGLSRRFEENTVLSKDDLPPICTFIGVRGHGKYY